jgi:thiazole synthase
LLDSLEAGQPALVTLAIRRVSLEAYAESLVDLLDGRYALLPNTAGCATVKDAVLTAELAREALETDWIKLEIIGDRETLYPDVEQLLRGTEELVRKGLSCCPIATTIRSPAASSPISAPRR